MAKKTLAFVETFFNFDDAVEWRSGHLEDNLVGYEGSEWHVVEDEIKMLRNGLYRAGLVLANEQYELFGATEDA